MKKRGKNDKRYITNVLMQHHLIRPHTKIKIWQFKWTS